MAFLGALMVEESVIREQESKTLQSEAEWFIGNEMPSVCQKMQRILQHCAGLLSPKGNKEELPLLPTDYDVPLPFESVNRLISFETPEGTLKGFVNVAGWSVSEAEIVVKFPKWNKNVPYKAAISATHPWRLTQLQNAYNSIRATIDELQLLVDECERFRVKALSNLHPNLILPHSHTSLQLSPRSSNKPPLLRTSSSSALASGSVQPPSAVGNSLSTVNKIFEQVSRWMSHAKDALMIPSKNLFPNSLFATTGFQGFHPSLPQDLHIEFSVCNSEIIISVYALHIGTGPLPPLERMPSNPGSLNSIGSAAGAGGAKGASAAPEKTPTSSQTSSPTNTLRHKTPSVSNLLNLPHSLTGFEKTVKNEDGDANSKKDSEKDSEAPRDLNAQQDYRVSIGGISYKTYQCTFRGGPSWVAVLDQSEVHCIIPRVNNTLALLSNAQDILADTADKLVALSLL